MGYYPEYWTVIDTHEPLVYQDDHWAAISYPDENWESMMTNQMQVPDEDAEPSKMSTQ